MLRQPALKHSWNTMVASSFWDVRLSIACAATDAEYQGLIILHDNTLNLPVVARQPHLDPNYALFTAARRVAGSCALTPSSPARAPRPSEVSDPIVTIDT